jgi:hypothetical protein
VQVSRRKFGSDSGEPRHDRFTSQCRG